MDLYALTLPQAPVRACAFGIKLRLLKSDGEVEVDFEGIPVRVREASSPLMVSITM